MAGPGDAPTPAPLPPPRRYDRVLLGLLLVSLILRGLLVSRGGPGFWGDESRYDVSVSAAEALHAGNLGAAFEEIFSKADHLGFKLAMVLPALGQAIWGWSNAVVVFLGPGLFSTLNIAWVYALARRAGARVPEARWSALLMAASASMFYWSRHLVPYDMALFWGLACLFVGLHPAVRWWHSLLAGVLGFVAFITYNGAWLFVAFALVTHVLRGWPSWKNLLVRGALGLLGLAGSIGLLAAGAYYAGLDLFTAYARFAGTVTQGDFADGYFVLGKYLWDAEHGLVLIWAGSALLFLGTLVWRRAEGWARPALWLGGVAVIGLALVLFSNVFTTFVVYGRLVRQIVPFLALLGGWALAWPGARPGAGRWLGPALLVLVGALAAPNFGRPFTQVFPTGFYRRGNLLKKAYLDQLPDEAARGRANARFRFIYTGFIWPMPEHYDLPPHEVMLQRPHPLQYEPYLYEGFNREQRAAIHATDVSMRLILIKD